MDFKAFYCSSTGIERDNPNRGILREWLKRTLEWLGQHKKLRYSYFLCLTVLFKAHPSSFPIQQIVAMSGRLRRKVVSSKGQLRDTVVADQGMEDNSETTLSFKKTKINVSAESNPYELIEEIPVIELTKDDMLGDPIELIMKLQQRCRSYGAVKLKACPEWNPPFNFKYSQKPITTRIQKIHRLKQGKPFDEKEQAYSIKSFSEYAKNFEKTYKFKFETSGSTPEAKWEQEYWQLVKGVQIQDKKLAQRYKVTSEYAADLPVHRFGSGFPLNDTPRSRDDNFSYATNHFNLNRLYQAPASLFGMSERNEERISGITVPWVYMGMLFSTFCWHVEDLWINSINYSHTGATKTWYVVPESQREKFDAYVIKTTGKREFLNSITYMLDPLELKAQGIKVYKAYQRPKEYILTLFNAYHSGFAQGFNVGEAVNVGNADSLATIVKALKDRARLKNPKPPVLSFQWLVLNNLGNNSVNPQVVQKHYQQMVQKERFEVANGLKKWWVREVELIDPRTKYDRHSCCQCHFYQYISLLKCKRCAKRYCMAHAHNCCAEGLIFMTRQPNRSRKAVLTMVKKQLT